MSDEEKKAIKRLEKFGDSISCSDYPPEAYIEMKEDIEDILYLIEKQSKEIEELKDMNERQKYRIELVSEDKIEERGDSIDESTMLKQIKSKLDEKNIPIETLLAEFERLEDIEDRKVQVDYERVFNKGVNSVENKIKAKIEELEKDNLYDCYKLEIKVLQSLLEKE